MVFCLGFFLNNSLGSFFKVQFVRLISLNLILNSSQIPSGCWQCLCRKQQHAQLTSAGYFKSWIVYWLTRVLNSIILHSSRGRLIPCSRLELDVPLRALVAGLQKAVCLFSEASINHLSELWAGHFLCETDSWPNPVGQVLNSCIYS